MDQASPPPRITVEAFNRLLDESAPFQKIYGFVTEEIGFGTASVRLPAGDAHVRPGGTLSSPPQTALADLATYAPRPGALGEVPLAGPTRRTIHFRQRPRPGRRRATCRLPQVGQRLAEAGIPISSQALAT